MGFPEQCRCPVGGHIKDLGPDETCPIHGHGFILAQMTTEEPKESTITLTLHAQHCRRCGSHACPAIIGGPCGG